MDAVPNRLTVGLTTTEMYSLTVLEARAMKRVVYRAKIKVWPDHAHTIEASGGNLSSCLFWLLKLHSSLPTSPFVHLQSQQSSVLL